MFFSEDHLRVTKTKTIDGVNPVYDDQQRVVKKVVHLPLAAKKYIEEQNTLLPNQIKMKVEVIKAYKPEQIPAGPDPAVIEMQQKIAELEAKNKELQEKAESGTNSKTLKNEKV